MKSTRRNVLGLALAAALILAFLVVLVKVGIVCVGGDEVCILNWD